MTAEFIEFSEIEHDPSNIIRTLMGCGILFCKNIPSDPDKFAAICARLGTIRRDGSASVDGISRLRYDAARASSAGGKGYSHDALFPHTDRSGSEYPPRFLINAILESAPFGGASTFVLGRRMVALLASDYPELLRLLCRSDIAVFRRKESMLSAPIIELSASGDFKIRFRLDEGIYLPPNALGGLSALRDVIERILEVRSFRSGEGYIVDNHRVLHGRQGYTGSREVWRILIE